MRTPSLTPLLAVLLLVATPGLVGCVETRTTARWDKLREIADPPPSTSGGTRRGLYAIQLRALYGTDRLKQAFAFSAGLRETGQIPGIWFVERGDSVVVYAGRFRDPESDDAKDSLRRARRANFEGTRPFRRADLVAIDPGQNGVADRWDLRQHRGFRSLVLEVYDVDGASDFRRRAEERAEELRYETDLDVYYFLGSYQAYVCVGIFDPNVDYVMANGVETPGPRIIALRERFPHVQYNGEPMKATQNGTPDGLEPTVVIKVP